MYANLEHKDKLFVLKDNYLGHLAYVYQDKPFVVPITYFFEEERNVIICYSGEGHKMNAMRKNKQVALNVVDLDALTKWKSVMAQGTFEQLFGSDAKSYLHDFSLGIKKLAAEKELKELSFISEFSSKLVDENIPMIFVIKIDEITGKMRDN